jgi:hypothetical protein
VSLTGQAAQSSGACRSPKPASCSPRPPPRPVADDLRRHPVALRRWGRSKIDDARCWRTSAASVSASSEIGAVQAGNPGRRPSMPRTPSAVSSQPATSQRPTVLMAAARGCSRWRGRARTSRAARYGGDGRPGRRITQTSHTITNTNAPMTGWLPGRPLPRQESHQGSCSWSSGGGRCNAFRPSPGVEMMIGLQRQDSSRRRQDTS